LVLGAFIAGFAEAIIPQNDISQNLLFGIIIAVAIVFSYIFVKSFKLGIVTFVVVFGGFIAIMKLNPNIKLNSDVYQNVVKSNQDIKTSPKAQVETKKEPNKSDYDRFREEQERELQEFKNSQNEDFKNFKSNI
jgi:uncharacterized membrane protein YgaE (UPF0421/DUF939 family)